MAILIVDPNDVTRKATAELCRSLDKRHLLEAVSNGATAFELAMKRSPFLVIFDLELPDMRGEELCFRLRQHLPNTTFLASAQRGHIDDMGTFDGVLCSPTSRVSLIYHFTEAHKRSKMASRFPPIVESEILKGQYLPRVKANADTNSITVGVSLHGDSLKFSVPFPRGCNVKDALAKMGRQRCTWVKVKRAGQELCVSMDCQLEGNDELIICI